MKTLTDYIQQPILEFNSGAKEDISYEDLYSLMSIIMNNVDNVSEKDASFLIKFFDKKHTTLKNWINSNHNNELSTWMENTL